MSQDIQIYDGSRPLKDNRRETFCQLVLEHNSPHKAYEAAGFKRARGNCHRLMREPKVGKRLEYLWAGSARQAEISGGRWLARAEAIADANMFDFWDIEDGQLRRLNLSKVPYAMGAIIQEIGYDTKGRPRLKLYGADDMQKFLIERALPKPQRLALTDGDGASITPVVVNILRFSDGPRNHPPQQQLAPA